MIHEVRQDTYVPGAEETDLLMIYTRYNRITIGSLKNSHQKSTLTLKMGYILYLWGGEESPKTAPGRV